MWHRTSSGLQSVTAESGHYFGLYSLFCPWLFPEELRPLWGHPKLCPHRALAPEQVLEESLWISADNSQTVPLSFPLHPVISGLLESTTVPGNKRKGIFHRFKGCYTDWFEWERRCSLLRLREYSLFLQVTHPGTAHTFQALPAVHKHRLNENRASKISSWYSKTLQNSHP